MEALLSVGGTWHAPHLAHQLQKRGMLKAVYTTIPRARFCSRASINASRFVWLPWPELVGPRTARLLRVPTGVYGGSYEHAAWFDRLVGRALSQMRPDIVVSFASFGLSTLRRCRAEGIPAVIERGSAHTCIRRRILAEERERLGLESVAEDSRMQERELMEYEVADYIALPSAFAEDSFIEMGVPREKIIKIPYGVDTSRFRPSLEPTRHFKVASIGNLGVEKGIGDLIDSMEILDGLDIRLLLAGTMDRYAVRRLSASNIKWEFAGRVDQRSLPDLYGQASVYCLLSLQEGMSMTVLEAMACGLPVVASANTGAADIISDGVDGFIVPIRNPEAAAEKIKQLHDDPELRKQMGTKARNKALLYTWDCYGERIAAAYRRITNGAISSARRNFDNSRIG